MDSMIKELARENSNFDILVFLQALKECYRDAKRTFDISPYDPTKQHHGSISIRGHANMSDMVSREDLSSQSDRRGYFTRFLQSVSPRCTSGWL